MLRIRSKLSATRAAQTLTLTTFGLVTSCGTESDEAIELATSSQALSRDHGSVGFVTSSKPYVVPVTPEYSIQPLLSAADRIPRTSDPSQLYQMVGIPDGMGAYRTDKGETIVYMNHELVQAAMSEPVLGQPLNRGAIVSRLVLDRQGRLVSGDRAYDTVYAGNVLLGPAPAIDNTTGAFARFCSGSLSYKDAGFDRPIYLAGEESGGAATFDGRGGLAIAIFDGELHTLPKFGRFSWENTLAQPKDTKRTVLIGMEDGPSSPDNQLYMYVGTKDKQGANGLARNGLDNGKMYAFVSTTPGINSDPEFTSGSITGTFAEIPNAEALTDAELEVAADAIGAYGFIRTEDGAFDPKDPDVFYFVTTGGAVGNELGRIYKLVLNADDPTGPATIELLINADAVIAAGGDTAISPDNISVSKDYIMINEDGTAQSRVVMAAKGRDGSVWRLDKNNGYAATRVAELFPPGRDANFAVTSGIWETTGVLSISGFGHDAWLMNVQAHAPTGAPTPNVVEDGQLVLMRRTEFDTLSSE